MTINQRIHELSFCYDEELPPSVPAGEPLRPSAQPKEKRQHRLLRRLGRRGSSRRG